MYDKEQREQKTDIKENKCTRMKEKKGTDIERRKRRQLIIRCDTDTQGQNSNRQESGCWTLILSDCPTLEGRRRRRKEKRKTIHSFVK